MEKVEVANYIERPVTIEIDDDTFQLVGADGDIICFGIVMLGTAEFVRDAINRTHAKGE